MYFYDFYDFYDWFYILKQLEPQEELTTDFSPEFCDG